MTMWLNKSRGPATAALPLAGRARESVRHAAAALAEGLPRVGAFLVTALLVAALLGGESDAYSAETGVLRGSIIGADATALVGSTVVLLRFTLGEDGTPKGGPIASQPPRPDGSYEFRDIALNDRAVYRVGARIGGEMIGSDMFTLSASQPEMRVDLRVVQAKSKSSSRGEFGIEQALMALEPGIGRLRVTAVFHFINPAAPRDTRQSPLILPVPEGATGLEIVRQEGIEGEVVPMADGVHVAALLPSGRFIVAYRYGLSAGLGSTTIRVRLPLRAQEMVLLAEPNGLRIEGPGIIARGSQRIEDTVYQAWGRVDVPAGTVLSIRVEGVPMRQSLLLIPMAVFLLAMGGIVWWYLGRLRRQQS